MEIRVHAGIFRSRIIVLLILIGAALVSISPVAAEKGVTILAYGDQSYFYGEEVILHGNNSVSDTTYLFITGPNLPAGGVKLTSPKESAVSGDPATFTAVKTGPDNTWEYTYYTANRMMDAGTFTIYAASQPTTDGLAANDSSGRVSIILKRPFITAEITPATITRGQPFTIAGIAEGDPAAVQLWIIGKNYNMMALVTPEKNASYLYEGMGASSESMPAGQYYLIVQHPMQNNEFEIFSDGDYVKNRLLGNMGLFRIRGPGSLQGSDAAEAFIAAINEPDIDDTYVIVPFVVEEAGTSALPSQTSQAAPAPSPTHASPLQFAPFGAFALIMGMLVLNRH